MFQGTIYVGDSECFPWKFGITLHHLVYNVASTNSVRRKPSHSGKVLQSWIPSFRSSLSRPSVMQLKQETYLLALVHLHTHIHTRMRAAVLLVVKVTVTLRMIKVTIPRSITIGNAMMARRISNTGLLSHMCTTESRSAKRRNWGNVCMATIPAPAF